jgi:hypothetical protein
MNQLFFNVRADPVFERFRKDQIDRALQQILQKKLARM